MSPTEEQTMRLVVVLSFLVGLVCGNYYFETIEKSDPDKPFMEHEGTFSMLLFDPWT